MRFTRARSPVRARARPYIYVIYIYIYIWFHGFSNSMNNCLHKYKILKFVDIVSLENCILVNRCFNDEAFSLFSNYFKLTASSHSYCTRSVSNGLIFKRLYNTFHYGNMSIINSIVSTWNHFQTIFHGHNLLNMSPKKVKSLISKYFFENYEE